MTRRRPGRRAASKQESDEAERAKLAAQVEDQRRRLNDLVANVPGVVWEAWGAPDAATQRIDFVSDHVETMLGYSVAEWLATPNFWLSIVHEEDRERAGREAAARFQSAKGGTSEFRWVAPDGRVLWVEARSTVITDENGKPAGMRGVTMDITDRKRAEEALRESEERYRDLVENAHDIIFTQDLSGNYTSMNAAVEPITGYTREEALAMNLAQLVAPDHLERARQAIIGKLVGENVTAHDLEMIAKDGRRIAMEVNIAIILEAGVPVGVQGIARDVTARKKLEAQLRQAQRVEAIGLLGGALPTTSTTCAPSSTPTAISACDGWKPTTRCAGTSPTSGRPANARPRSRVNCSPSVDARSCGPACRPWSKGMCGMPESRLAVFGATGIARTGSFEHNGLRGNELRFRSRSKAWHADRLALTGASSSESRRR